MGPQTLKKARQQKHINNNNIADKSEQAQCKRKRTTMTMQVHSTHKASADQAQVKVRQLEEAQKGQR